MVTTCQQCLIFNHENSQIITYVLGKPLESRKYSFQLFTGFSFTDSLHAYPNIVEESTEDLFIFLQQFLRMFPELQKCEFYPFGESYAGKYVPALAHKIHYENTKIGSKWLKINLGWQFKPIKNNSKSFLHNFFENW